MNPEFKDKWIQALRSGSYQQGKFRLKSVREGQVQFCCMGVALDLMNASRWNDPEPDVRYGGDHFSWSSGVDYISCTEISYNLAHTLGLPIQEASRLAILNDQDMRSFLEIADYIEKNIGSYIMKDDF